MQQTFNADMNISNLHQNVDPSTTLPVICGVEITTDRAGRYNLNALHRASGLGAHKAPAQWLRTLSAKQLIEELEKETMQNCIVSFEGRGGGRPGKPAYPARRRQQAADALHPVRQDRHVA